MHRVASSVEEILSREGYVNIGILDSHEIVGVFPFLFTWGLVVGLTKDGYRTRFCYPSLLEASIAAETWDGKGDPPGPWIKEKGRGLDGIEHERTNPLVNSDIGE